MSEHLHGKRKRSIDELLYAVGSGEKFIMLDNGLPLGYNKIESVNDAKKLANNMANTGYYPAGLDPCFAAGINGGWENGVCPIYRIDKSECSCGEEWWGEFEEILSKEEEDECV